MRSCPLRLALCLLVSLSSACNKSSPTEPAVSMTGRWVGSIEDGASGSGALTLQIVQSGSGLAGTWSAMFSAPIPGREAPLGSLGSLSGSVNGDNVLLSLTPVTPPVCATGASLSGTMAVTAAKSGKTMGGTYVALDCASAPPVSGRIDVEKD